MDSPYWWKKTESPSLIEDGKLIRCKSGKHVPIVAGSKEPRKPDDPSKGSRDRPRKILQSVVKSQENPGQATGYRLHLPGVYAPGDRSHKVPR